MKIWIDITNSPHVWFFKDIISKLQKDHFEVLVTCREHAEIISLLKKFKIAHVVVGKHAGKSKIKKLLRMLQRDLKLMRLIAKERPTVSLSCGSPYASQISFLFRIPHIISIDNETATLSNYITLPFGKTIIVPRVIPLEKLTRYLVGAERILQYDGFKETAYLDNFHPDSGVLKELGLKPSDNIIVIRPEPSTALYYKGHGDLIREIIVYLVSKKNYKIILIYRTREQRESFAKEFGDKVILPVKAVDFPSLACYSKLVISGGGTMIREAAMLGVPAISTYPLKIMLSVDHYLLKIGLVRHVSSLKEFEAINLTTLRRKSRLKLTNPAEIIIRKLYKEYK